MPESRSVGLAMSKPKKPAMAPAPARASTHGSPSSMDSLAEA